MPTRPIIIAHRGASGYLPEHTLAEEIDLIAGLDRSRNCNTGLYVELKSPNWHEEEGQNLATAILEVLQDKGYADRPGQVFLQCFDDKTLRHLRHDLKTPLPLIQLIGENDWGEDSEVDYDYLQTPQGLVVHPCTFRRDELPEGIGSFRELLDIFVLQAGIDGLFTDFPDIVSDYLQQ